MGVESHILSPSEAKELYPLLNISDLKGALYSPTDGHIDPNGYCNALARGAKKRGAQVSHTVSCDFGLENLFNHCGPKSYFHLG